MKTALKITGIYFIVGLLWILVSDEMVLWFVGDDVLNIKAVQTLKGIFFVTVTAAILFLLLKNYYRKLDKKIIQLEDLNKQLQQSNQELEQFAYVASHDLQEPLRMVSSFLERLEYKYQNQLDEKAHQYIYYAVDGAERMRQIILDLLEYSRIGQTNIKKETIALEEIINAFCESHKKDIDTKKATFHYNSLPEINSYRTSLTQIFHNLLDNALKYSKEGLPPEITVTAEDRGAYWQFSIADNGIGIPEGSAEDIFVIFRRLEDREQYTGSGIGLSIVKKNIEKLNGTIWVQSGSGKGATFYFTLKK
tara:strand:+ start:5672 stop:6592 length:921 start_codon:yes stop_codon:yes gene_type:complete